MERPSPVPLEHGGLSRRQFLRGSAGMAALLALKNVTWAQGVHPEAINDYLQDVADTDIPGLDTVNTLFSHGATRGLCMIQAPEGYFFRNNMADPNRRHLEACQEEMYDGLSWMMDDKRIRLRQIFRENVLKHDDFMRMAATTGHPALRQKPSPSELVRLGAERVLAEIRGLEIKGLEDESAMKEVRAEWTEKMRFQGETVAYNDPRTRERREDGWLKVLQWTGWNVNFALAGAEHDLRDNVSNWNRHFNNHISLAVLAPRSLNL